MNEPLSQPEPTKTTRRKRWAFRCGAILFGITIVIGLEMACRLAGIGEPSLDDDPYVGFANVTPLFEKQGDFYEVAPARLKFFAADSFPITKPKDHFRIFVLGGSTVQGRPYSLETAFGTWLQLGLQAEHPDRNWDVVQCGGLSYASYRLVPLLEECLDYAPDLIVICTGHNEFLEDRSYKHLKPETASEQFIMNLSANSHLFHLFQRAIHSSDRAAQSSNHSENPKPKLTGEVDAILDYNDSLAAYHRDDDWRQQIVEHYRFNIRRMTHLCRERNIPLVMVRPPANLADSPPFKSDFSESLSSEVKNELKERLDVARENYRDNLSVSIEALEEIVHRDPRFALAWYELGQCYLTRKQYTEAKQAFLKARDEDICPLRIVSELEDALIQITSQEEVPLVDAYLLLEEKSRSGILDSQWLADHVHPTVPGHQVIAAEIQRQMRDINLCDFTEESAARQQMWNAHLQSLDDYYFLKGQETLKSLRGWAAGRADGSPAASRFPHRVSKRNLPLTNEFDDSK